jgi:putative hydrolase of the HAD superfamily
MTRRIEATNLPLDRLRSSFVSWANDQRVQLIALDYDDTLCDTIGQFRKYLNFLHSHLSYHHPALSRKEWSSNIERINNELFEAHGVHPSRWHILLDRLVDEFSLSPDIKASSQLVIDRIYQTPIKLHPSVYPTMEFLKSTGLHFAIVTHADEPWTHRKFDQHGLSQFLGHEDVYCIDPHGHKTADSWRTALEHFNCPPHQALIIGDSLRSDINPALQLGARAFWLEGCNTWSVHQLPTPDHSNLYIARDLSDLMYLGLPETRS